MVFRHQALEIIQESVDPHRQPNLTITNGSPRYAHKTTEIVHEASESDNDKLFLAHNHEHAAETIREVINGEEYGVGERSVVHAKGMMADGNECTCEQTNSDRWENSRAARNALAQHGVVTPQVFSDSCPYHSTKQAAYMARWIVCHPTMYARMDHNQLGDRDVIIDEESTMDYFMPDSATLLTLEKNNSDFFDRNFRVDDPKVSDANPDSLRDAMDRQTEDMENILGRYQNIYNICDAFDELHDTLKEAINGEDSIRNCEDTEEIQERLNEIGCPNVDPVGSDREINATYDKIRIGNWASFVAKVGESLLNNATFDVEGSGDEVNIRIIPDGFNGFLMHKDLFYSAENVYLVGQNKAIYFASHFHRAPNSCYQDITDHREIRDNLEIAVVSDEDEFQRRNFMTNVAEELTQQDIHNLLVCGSGTRASQAHKRIHPRSYYFRGGSTLREYEDMSDLDYNVTSYMGSRLTRGVDVDTQVTIVRSAQFSSPQWKYGNFEEVDDPSELEEGTEEYEEHHKAAFQKAMAEYENVIETHNAMLRGAGQEDDDGNPQKHIAVIPSIQLYFNFYRYVTEYSTDELEQLVNDVIEHIDDEVPDDLTCRNCDRRFVTRQGYRDHECIGDPTGIVDRSPG